MKIFLALMLGVTFSFANYSIYYGGLKLGTIHSLETIHKNYLKIHVSNPIARLLLGKKKMIFYNNQYDTGLRKDTIKYKEDSYQIINILKKSLTNTLIDGTIFISDKKYITIKKEKDYTFEYISKGKMKSNGSIKIDNKQLISLIDERNRLKIIKN